VDDTGSAAGRWFDATCFGHRCVVIRWLARVLLLRVLPRRLVPLLTVLEVVQLARALRRRRAAKDRLDSAQLTLPPPTAPPIPTDPP
jgi:hypothetical protein